MQPDSLGETVTATARPFIFAYLTVFFCLYTMRSVRELGTGSSAGRTGYDND